GGGRRKGGRGARGRARGGDAARGGGEGGGGGLPRAGTGGLLGREGNFFGGRLPGGRPPPARRPHPPIWRSVISVDSLVECGRAGVPVMMSRVPNARIAERLGRYREGLEAGGHDAATQRRPLAEASARRLLSAAHSRAPAA